jgi:hypothetical protein
LTPHEGNVYVRDRPVCDDQWGLEEAEVVCRQLGFPGAADYTTLGRFGSAEGVFLMSNVTCGGEERRLTDCRHDTRPGCSAMEAAGVVCRPGTNATSTPPPPLETCGLSVHSGDWANMDSGREFAPSHVLQDDCDSFLWGPPPTANYWLAPSSTPGSLVLDLGCTKVLDGIKLKNTHNGHHNDRGTKNFTISISNSTAGPWRTIFTGSLTDARNMSCEVPLEEFRFDASSLSEDQRMLRALRLETVSWYGAGAGLQHMRLLQRAPGNQLPAILGCSLAALIIALGVGIGVFIKMKGIPKMVHLLVERIKARMGCAHKAKKQCNAEFVNQVAIIEISEIQ